MLSGLKFIPRAEVEKSRDEELEDSRKDRKKSKSKKDKSRHKKRRSHYSSDEDLERIKSGSKKKKKWYASDEESSSSAGESDGDSDSEYDDEERNSSSKKKEKQRRKSSLGDEGGGSTKKRGRSRRKDASSEDYSSSDSGSGSLGNERHNKGGKRKEKTDKRVVVKDGDVQGGSEVSESRNLNELRKQMGLDFMLRPKDATEKVITTPLDNQQELQVETEEIKKANPKELNPYFKDNGSGYPEELDGKTGRTQLMSSSVVGDGGASWRLKALKRAQEQAAREGRNFEEVVQDRWGSLGQLAVSVAAHKVAPAHAHIHAIKSRRRGSKEEEQTDTNKQNEMVDDTDGSRRQAKMRVPKVQNSLHWGKSKMTAADSSLSAAISTINKFSNDGSFMNTFVNKQSEPLGDHLDSSNIKAGGEIESSSMAESIDGAGSVRPALTANQLAAKVLQLRMKGKHEEAEKLMKESETIKVKAAAESEPHKPHIDGTRSRYIMHDFSARQKRKEDDGDLHLAQRIARNHQFKVSGQADDEYDYDDGPRRKPRHKGRGDNQNANEASQVAKFANRMLTQKERCQFCFENPERPKHLVVAIANFTYLSLPRWQPIVPGHCYILTLQHEASTRTVDDNVWDEIRNFKKCLIMMFSKQDKDVIFLETVMGLAQQRRHCLVECIPVPKKIAKQGPMYFKKAIDEAEEEWSQHNAKKLIDTSQKGLRASIPKNFPYFHVEFGLDKGFVHVIDDETQFKSNFGLNVIRGMLRLPAEDMHSRRKHESIEVQKQSVASFAQDWSPFDWTKQLE
ncbi:OLC1v1019814C1 [Oldenlandia corymbosa var. corymbosa]|uniref:OLC1v1019814C1 n=1 Tax=Oldenlandia corymbosa var. corymbosa TaxID=529605 RepID=A0AAV1EF09_OLDCO|nr:OLC1v1019814C1 [Oldenlandia corymbosa var. corymbosa]